MAEVETPVWGYELQDWMNIGSVETPSWVQVSNLLSWEFDDEEEAYEPDYIDVKNPKRFVVGRSASIEYEKDMYRNSALDTFLANHEGESNVPVEICRVWTWIDGASEGTVYAKKAAYLLSAGELDKNSSGEPVKLKGSLAMSDDEWTKGSWNTATPGFVDGDSQSTTDPEEQPAG